MQFIYCSFSSTLGVSKSFDSFCDHTILLFSDIISNLRHVCGQRIAWLVAHGCSSLHVAQLKLNILYVIVQYYEYCNDFMHFLLALVQREEMF